MVVAIMKLERYNPHARQVRILALIILSPRSNWGFAVGCGVSVFMDSALTFCEREKSLMLKPLQIPHGNVFSTLLISPQTLHPKPSIQKATPNKISTKPCN